VPDHFLSEEYMDQDLFVLGEETPDDCAISCRENCIDMWWTRGTENNSYRLDPT
jgi:hypothetical protein